MRPPPKLSRFNDPGDIAPVSEIIDRAIPACIESGVYFLIKANRVVYVGQSAKVLGRISSHVGWKDFDSWAWLPVPANDLDKMERAYIDALQPEWNQDVVTLMKRRMAG